MASIFLFALHEDIPSELKNAIRSQCVNVLNDEWPRSETWRLRSLDSSREGYPMCLALVKRCLKTDQPFVLGHVKLSKIPSKPASVWIESVVIHPDLRGKGIGKYLMLKTEQFCIEQEFRTAYLCTIDKQIFYSKCGYKFCEPVTVSSGKVMLRNGFLGAGGGHSFQDLAKAEENEEKFECADKELGAICERHFETPSLPANEPEIQTPLRSLVKTNKSVAENKSDRITIHKDFMKKTLVP